MKDCNQPAPRFARHRLDFRSAHGFFVIDPDGEVAEGPFLSKALAERVCAKLQRDWEVRHRIGPRPCLCCGRTFHSEGIHNRMCGHCRGRSDHLGDIAFAGAQDGKKPRKAARV